MNERDEIRKRIIERMTLLSSMYGMVAKYVRGDSMKEEQHIFECYRQIHHKNFKDHLGKELFNDLVKYNVQYNDKTPLTLAGNN